MRVTFRELNNKGQRNARPWRVETAAGSYVTSFERQAAANEFLFRSVRRGS